MTMKGFKVTNKSKQAVVDLASGEIVAEREAPYVRPPWFRARLVFHCYGESRTQQHHKDLTDINNIVNRYARTGEMPPAKSEPSYADVSELQGDLGERIVKSRETIDKAEAHFERRKAEKAKADKEAAEKPKLDGGQVQTQERRSTAPSSNGDRGSKDGGSPPEK